jgi:hypothetical protein
LERIHAIKGVANLKGRHGRLAVFVLHPQRYGPRWLAVEQHIGFAAKSDVLCALTGVKHNLGLAPARVPAEELDDAVFEGQPAQGVLERLFVVHRQVEPKIAGIRRRVRAAEELSGRR